MYNVAVAQQVLEEIIDDVMTSATINPSVPAVVFEVVTEIASGGDSRHVERAEEEGENIEYSENDISDIIDSEVAKDKEAKKEADTEEKSDNLEVQEVKVQVTEEKAENKEEPKVITFGGKPVPETGVVIINGYATSVQEPSSKEKTEAPEPVVPTPPSDFSFAKQQSAIPQTDLDTVSSQDLDVSNPDDDTSDKKSDTGSINTIDSVEKEPEGESSTAVVSRRKKGNIRPRNVRCFSVCGFLCVCVCVCAWVHSFIFMFFLSSFNLLSAFFSFLFGPPSKTQLCWSSTLCWNYFYWLS